MDRELTTEEQRVFEVFKLYKDGFESGTLISNKRLRTFIDPAIIGFDSEPTNYLKIVSIED